jgi:putative transposase
VPRDWQDTTAILPHFARTPRRAISRHEAFVREGVPGGRRPDLVGGGLLRSLGGWVQVLALRRKGSRLAADTRVLGSGAFTARLLAEAGWREQETLRLARKVVGLPTLAQQVVTEAGIAAGALRSGTRRRAVVRARRLFCQVAVTGMGDAGAEVARFLGVTTSAVNRVALSEELRKLRQYLNMF